MPQFYLDSNVFIEAKNRYYPLDLMPVFWDWLDDQITAGNIVTSTLVYDELKDGNDDLAQWVKDRKNSGLFIEPNSNSQSIFTQVSQFVVQNYNQAQAGFFLSKADPWIIAQCKDANGPKIVTHERLVPSESQKVKIPNVCQQFGVQWCDTFAMMRVLGAQFVS